MPLQFAPLLSPKSISHAHHILVFLCEGMNLTGYPDVGVKQKCDGISEEVQPCKYATIIGGWAIGGNVSNIAIKLVTVSLIIHMHFCTGFYITRRGCTSYWWRG